MQIDQSPVFRKSIVPWYDSDAACILTTAVMFIVFLFALDGVKVARYDPKYQGFIWVPALIAILSVIVCVSMIVRYFIRRFKQHQTVIH